MQTEYFAVTTLGSELIAEKEITDNGGTDVKIQTGGIHFKSNLEALYRLHLWTRSIQRILMPLKDFAALDATMLYDQIRRIKWEEYFNNQNSFCIDTVLSQKKEVRPNRFNHSLFTAQKIKDAIVDRFRDRTGSRPNVDKRNPDFRIHAYFSDGRCRLSLDASGRSLHERGYRQKYAEAPLRETLAATIIQLTGYQGDVPLVDPMCGSGTLSIEAAMIALKQAPGLGFQDFTFLKWPNVNRELFSKLEAEARKMRLRKLKEPIFASDVNPKAIQLAERAAQQALGPDVIRFEVADFFKKTHPELKPGILILNPPYGERLGPDDQSEIEAFYKSIGDQMKHHWKSWNAYIFSGNRDALKRVGLKTKSKIKLYNGPIECRLMHYPLY